MTLTFAFQATTSIPVHVIETSKRWSSFLADSIGQCGELGGRRLDFTAVWERHRWFPGDDGLAVMVLAGYAGAAQRARRRFHLADLWLRPCRKQAII